MARESNIVKGRWFIGADHTIRVDVDDGADQFGATGTAAPVNMTGWALEFVLKKAADDPTALLSKTTAGGAITIGNGAATGDRATVTITDDDTLTLKPGTYHYTLRRTDAGSEQPLAYGSAVLELVAGR